MPGLLYYFTVAPDSKKWNQIQCWIENQYQFWIPSWICLCIKPWSEHIGGKWGCVSSLFRQLFEFGEHHKLRTDAQIHLWNSCIQVWPKFNPPSRIGCQDSFWFRSLNRFYLLLLFGICIRTLQTFNVMNMEPEKGGLRKTGPTCMELRQFNTWLRLCKPQSERLTG